MEKAFGFFDQLEPLGIRPVRVFARIQVMKAEDGGRKGPFTRPFRPNHNFGGPENRLFFIGQIEIPEGVWIHPGETHELVVSFLNVKGLSENAQAIEILAN